MSTVLLASSGGHLTQLHQLRPRLVRIDEPVHWVTFDTAQSRSLLAGERVSYIAHAVTRDYRSILANVLPAHRMLRDEVSSVVSTGAGIAMAFLPQARARGIACHYIESATRVAGPSLTGRMLRAIPRIRLYTQHEQWADGPWRFAGSVFDGYEVEELRDAGLRKVVVTLGAHEVYGFRRLVERLTEIIPSDAEVLWQTGSTDVTGLEIDARAFVPAAELMAAASEADVVISHAGIGSILSTLEAGRLPVVVAREARHGEHVDDHQAQAAAALSRIGLAHVRPLEDLELADLEAAAAHRVRRGAAPPFRLDQS